MPTPMVILSITMIISITLIASGIIYYRKFDKQSKNIKHLGKNVIEDITKAITKEIDKAKTINNATDMEFFSPNPYDFKQFHYDTKQYEASLSKLDELEHYAIEYRINILKKANLLTNLSIAAAILGFFFIIYIILAKSTNELEVILNIVSTAITASVPLLFFKQASEMTERADKLVKELIDNKNKQLIKVMEDIEAIDDAYIQSVLKARIALHMPDSRLELL